jgi:hypothetical protein
MVTTKLDRAKVRALIRRLDDEATFVLLDRAIEFLPQSGLAKLIHGYARPEELRDAGAPPKSLLQKVREFHAEAVAGAYYQDFLVDSKNFMSTSGGTRRFLADYHRLLDACVAAVGERMKRVETRAAFELLFDLLRRIDACSEDIVFFADEAGSWQIGVHWPEVAPAYARCLSKQVPPDDVAAAVDRLISEHAAHDRGRILAVLRRLVTKAESAALSAMDRARVQSTRARAMRRPG